MFAGYSENVYCNRLTFFTLCFGWFHKSRDRSTSFLSLFCPEFYQLWMFFHKLQKLTSLTLGTRKIYFATNMIASWYTVTFNRDSPPNRHMLRYLVANLICNATQRTEKILKCFELPVLVYKKIATIEMAKNQPRHIHKFQYFFMIRELWRE